MKKAILLAMLMILAVSLTCNAIDIPKEIEQTNEDFYDKNISTKWIEDYKIKIENFLKLENYEEADKTFNSMNLEKEKILIVYDKVKKYEGILPNIHEENGRMNISEKIRGAFLELNLGNFDEALKISVQIENETQKIYAEKIANSIKTIEKLNFSSKKSDDLKNFGKGLKATDFEKIDFLEKETGNFADSAQKIKETSELEKEYLKIIPGKRFQDGIEEMMLNLEIGNYQKIKDISEELKNTLEYAKEAKNSIEYAKSQNYQSETAKKNIEDSEREIEKERFQESISFIEKAIAEGEKEKSRKAVIDSIQENFVKKTFDFFKNNFIFIAAGIILFVIILVLNYKNIRKIYVDFKSKKLEKKEKETEEMIKQIQEDYFIKKKISKREYKIQLSKQQEKMVKLKEKIQLLR